MPPKVKGSYSIRRQRAKKRSTAESKSYAIPIVGPYPALEASEPAIGASFSGYPSDYFVTDVSLEDTGGGSGKMVVTIEKKQPGNPEGSQPTQIGETVYELDWSEERRPIFEHPKCPKLKPDRLNYEYPDRVYSQGNSGKTDAEVSSDTEKFYKKRTWDNWQSMDAGDLIGGEWDVDTIKKLLEAGINDYPLAYPIASATKYALYRIAASGDVNAKSNPPSECGAPIESWFWIKCGARSTKQGKLYSLVETWRGYHKSSTEYSYIF